MKTNKIKRCAICKKDFKPYRTTQKVCSLSCALDSNKKKEQTRLEQKDRLEERRQQMKLDKGLRWSIERTVQVVHEYVKLRDKLKPCISCGTQWHLDFQAGHYFKAELFSSLKFYLMNIHGQCVQCNGYLEGNLNQYGLNLPERIGQDTFNELIELADGDKKQDFKWDKDTLKSIRVQVLKLTKELRE